MTSQHEENIPCTFVMNIDELSRKQFIRSKQDATKWSVECVKGWKDKEQAAQMHNTKGTAPFNSNCNLLVRIIIGSICSIGLIQQLLNTNLATGHELS